MAIDFKPFDSGKRYRLIWTGTHALGTEDGPRAPYVPFSASPKWVQGHHAARHRLLQVDDYAHGLAEASEPDLREHARRRGFSGQGTRGDLLKVLLAGIAAAPQPEDFQEPEPEALDVLSINQLRILARENGLSAGGTKDEIRARIESFGEEE